MKDRELIEAALLLKEEEDSELEKLFEQMGLLFVPVLLNYVLKIEKIMDDLLQTDFKEAASIISALGNKKTKPLKRTIVNALKKRTFKDAMKKEVLPEMRKAFFGLFDEFNNLYKGPSDFDYRTKSYKDIDKWLRGLPSLMNLSTEEALIKLIRKSYEDGKGIKWLESEIAKLPEFSRNRARTTAITEGLRMYSGSQYEAMMQNEYIFGKEWKHTHGISEPRKGHMDADGEIVAKDEYFIINGETCRYPRDPWLSARESVHCHCFMNPVLGDKYTK